jgi:hypothetical protein
MPSDKQNILSWKAKKRILLEEKKEFFKGLAIEEKLTDEVYATLPAILLEMSQIPVNEGKNVFNTALSDLLVDIAAVNHGIYLPQDEHSEVFL